MDGGPGHDAEVDDTGSSDVGISGDSGDGQVDAASDVDAFVPESCPTVGGTRTGPCGTRCGMAAQRCSDEHVWVDTSACIMEGECSSGTSETRPTLMCGEETRLCDNMCAWTAWEQTTADHGECNSGDTRFVTGGTCPGTSGRTERCDATCMWAPEGSCVSGCAGTERTSPPERREVCVPAGTFIRGEPTGARVAPEAEIFVSSFYIDAYPVTNRRLLECIDAGACPTWGSTVTRMYAENPSRLDYATEFAQWPQADAFCRWDGARRLPTEAEWEKAVRGPSPSRNHYPWDGTAYRCDLLSSYDCGYMPASIMYRVKDAYDALPGTRSVYGTEQQYGGQEEWVSDFYAADYYTTPESMESDPSGPATGVGHVLRGTGARQGSATLWLTYRQVDVVTSNRGFRCARSAE